MDLLVVSDIFGRTHAFDNLCDSLAESGINVDTLDPYSSQYRDFETEEDAYKAFQEETGLEKYTYILEQKVENSCHDGAYLLGFSVGASAIWAASPGISPKIRKGICFYSSQIRNYLKTQPNIQIELYFARSEPSYDVDEVAVLLNNTENVKTYKTKYLHGFMNQRSKNFNNCGYNKYIERIRRCLTCPTTGLNKGDHCA